MKQSATNKRATDARVWGPPFWFFLHSLADFYPDKPNAATKRRMYDLIHNVPLLLPDERMGARFAELLDKYPVSPYLSQRDSLMRWMHFIHNQVNHSLGKDRMTYLQGVDAYLAHYRPLPLVDMDRRSMQRHVVVFSVAVFLLAIAFMYA